MIHFDFDDRYQDELLVGAAISRREGVLMSVVVHGLLVVAMLFGPQLALFQPSADERARAEALRQQLAQPPRDNRTFVFVQPKVDLEAPRPPDRAEPSDKNRIARAPQVAPNPTNPLPFSRGNSINRTEQSQVARGTPTEPTAPDEGTRSTEETVKALPQADTGYVRQQEEGRLARGGSPLGEALRNLQRYIQNETFDNPQGSSSQEPGAAIQFDTKGVEFGPWIRRFVAQVKRNWFVPQAAWLLRGHVVLQFNIHKNGTITDLAVVAPSAIEAFNKAAYAAILTSNPTEPLPPEYPADKALFTVTFYYNEQPPAF